MAMTACNLGWAEMSKAGRGRGWLAGWLAGWDGWLPAWLTGRLEATSALVAGAGSRNLIDAPRAGLVGWTGLG
jgi:hypothetical protein